MASNDVRDILGLSGLNAEGSVKKPMRIEKEKKPEGISRELFQLIGGPPPVAFIKPAFKAKPNLRKKAVAWNYRAFTNPARDDTLELRHWVKASEDENQAYRFNEFNKVINIIDYAEQEYNNLFNNETDWTKEETDYLFELCRKYDLRFLVIADRYEWPNKRRTMEDLKERYYYVTKEINTSRANAGGGSKDNISSIYNFDKAREIERKKNLEYLFNRTPEQIKEEEVLLQEYERIEQNEKKFSKERENLLKMLNFQDINPSPPKRKKSLLNGGPTTPTADTSGAFFANSAESPPNKKMRRSSSSSVGTSTMEVHSPTDAYPPNAPRREKLPPGVVVRSQKIPPVKQSAINKVTKYLGECHLNTRPNMATETVCAKWAELQKGIVNMLELKRHVEKLENDLDTKKKLLAKAKANSTTQKHQTT
ncbi:746_t:CDS:10 [Ambispora leptoticha]|uniref:SWR1-complex protein 4 n=1 Tax=Ambispora leptoticha TaxID=144679 RepID=A0A9N8ZV19_9GLOM|nr:746_t:CDS:10 [Ambispora leptoticha]